MIRRRAGAPALRAEDALLLGATLALPWAFGGVPLWGFRSAALLVVSAAAVAWVRSGPAGLGLDRRARWLLPALLLGLWAALQLVPLPPSLLGRVSPHADALYRQTFPGYPGPGPADPQHALETLALERVPEAGQARPDDAPASVAPSVGGRWTGWRSISLLPGAGGEQLAWYVALLLGFVVARRRCAEPGVARVYRGALFALFVLLALFGLLQAATSGGALYWLRRTIDPGRPFGPYVAGAHFAGVMELGVPWLAGASLAALREAGGSGWRGNRGPVWAVGTAVCVVAGLATGSKGGAALLAAGLFALLLVAVRSARGRILAVLVFALLAAATALAVRELPLGERVVEFVEGSRESLGGLDRVIAWRVGLRMLADFAVTGCGYGAFRDAFPAYLPAGEQLRWEQLHNDFLEAAITGGLVGTALLAWLGWGFVRRAVRACAAARGDVVLAGQVIGLAALTAHAAFDFNHQIPANALLFVISAALLVARVDFPRSDAGARR